MIRIYLVTIFSLGLSDHQKVFIGLLLQFIKLVSSCSQQIMLTSQTTMRWWFSLIRKIVEEFAMTTLRQRPISLLLTNLRTSVEMDETLEIGNFHYRGYRVRHYKVTKVNWHWQIEMCNLDFVSRWL